LKRGSRIALNSTSIGRFAYVGGLGYLNTENMPDFCDIISPILCQNFHWTSNTENNIPLNSLTALNILSVFDARVYLGIPSQSSIFFINPWCLTNFGISAQPSQQYFLTGKPALSALVAKKLSHHHQ
jgi:hypothetical protein